MKPKIGLKHVLMRPGNLSRQSTVDDDDVDDDNDNDDVTSFSFTEAKTRRVLLIHCRAGN